MRGGIEPGEPEQLLDEGVEALRFATTPSQRLPVRRCIPLLAEGKSQFGLDDRERGTELVAGIRGKACCWWRARSTGSAARRPMSQAEPSTLKNASRREEEVHVTTAVESALRSGFVLVAATKRPPLTVSPAYVNGVPAMARSTTVVTEKSAVGVPGRCGQVLWRGSPRSG